MRSVTNGRAMIKRNVAPNVHVRSAVIALRVQFVHVMGFPHLYGHASATRYKVVALFISAAIKNKWIVGVSSIGGGVRVYRDKEVHVVGIHFFANLRQWAVKLIVFRVVCNVGIWPVVCSRQHDVLAFNAHLHQLVYHREGSHQHGSRLVESFLAWPTCFWQVGIRYGRHRTVVRSVASMPRIEVDTQLACIFCLCLRKGSKGHCYKK